MTTEEYQRLSDIFERFSSEKNVVCWYTDGVGAPRSYNGTVHLMDKTSFILAALELAKVSAPTVSREPTT